MWGINRSDDVAYLVLYDKGALLLHQLAMDIGREKFLSLAREVARMSPRDTEQFLSQLERDASKEVRMRFEASLKN